MGNSHGVQACDFAILILRLLATTRVNARTAKPDPGFGFSLLPRRYARSD